MKFSETYNKHTEVLYTDISEIFKMATRKRVTIEAHFNLTESSCLKVDVF